MHYQGPTNLVHKIVLVMIHKWGCLSNVRFQNLIMMKITTLLLRIVMSSGLEGWYQHFGETFCLYLLSSALKMETACFSKTSVFTYESKQCYNPQEQHCCPGNIHMNDDIKLPTLLNLERQFLNEIPCPWNSYSILIYSPLFCAL
jgi:hypothetical protein